MRLFTLIRKSFFLKIVCFTIFISFVPYVILGTYSLFQVKSLSSTMTEEQIKKTIDIVLKQKLSLLEKEAEVNNAKFMQTENSVNLIRRQAEFLFADPGSVSKNSSSINLMKRKQGYRWEPQGVAKQEPNLFLSGTATLSPILLRDFAKSKELSPLMKEMIQTEPMLKAVFFVFAESGWLVYPPINVDYEVSIHKLSPNIRIQDYEFYYAADALHNPERKVKWTRPYQDVTHWNWVVTATAPVYLPDNTLRGVVGVDFPLDHIVQHFLKLPFQEPHAFSFITNRNGNYIAGNQKNQRSLHSNLFFVSGQQLTLKPEILSQIRTEKGIVPVSSALEKGYLLFASMPSSDWRLNFYIPENDISAPIIKEANKEINLRMKDFLTRFLFFLGAGVILLIFFSFQFSRTVTGPIKNLTLALRKSGEGNYKEKIAVTSQDEIGNLTQTFNWMNETIEQLIEALEERAKDLEKKVFERTKELQEANIQIVNTYEQLKSFEESRSELILQISHDLKTPLTSIKGYLQVLNKYELSAKKEKEFIQSILARTNHTIQLIDDLFDLSALNMNQLPFEKEWINIDFLMEYALDIVISEVQGLDIEVETNYAADLPLVFVDPPKMNRALVNILSNAIKYSREQEKIKISITCYQKNESIIIEIKDNGMGISEENMKNIFTMFYREPKAKDAKITGSGLGTSIAKKIIEEHDGDIFIATTSDVGTTIVIVLPYHIE
ncbi:ATP-binding protein [Aneurinibacillus sp. UBA3580]|uniref:ATP-binding protein n=1 Tax=Aneurinibacillus sp. UBA3580 TaxID=1946041 RepID=UPI00257AD20A|nr:ATP-binding protein [Aneurinibacillus sp. UBA3580]